MPAADARKLDASKLDVVRCWWELGVHSPRYCEAACALCLHRAEPSSGETQRKLAAHVLDSLPKKRRSKERTSKCRSCYGVDVEVDEGVTSTTTATRRNLLAP